MFFANLFQGMTEAIAAVGATMAVPTVNAASDRMPSNFSVQPFTTGAPAACTFHVWGTTKPPAAAPVFPADYADLSGAIDGSAAGPGMVSIAFKPVCGIVVQVTALSAGGTVAFGYVGGR
jgi:hypothetical protein